MPVCYTAVLIKGLVKIASLDIFTKKTFNFTQLFYLDDEKMFS